MKKLILIYLIIFQGFESKISGQLYFDSINEAIIRMKVKQVDEFMKRFNYEYDADGQKLILTDSSLTKRKDYILKLFDYEWAAKNNDRPGFTKEVFEFVDSVVCSKNPSFIHYHDKNWFAIAKCKGKLNKNPIHLNILLNTEIDIQGNSKWVIKDVWSDFFNLSKMDTSYRSISPISHEMNFSKLVKAINNDSKNILAYTREGFIPEQLPIFLYLVKYGFLKIDLVEQINICFLQVPRWGFTISSFIREGTNAGWLICDLQKVSEKDKPEYIEKKIKELP